MSYFMTNFGVSDCNVRSIYDDLTDFSDAQLEKTIYTLVGQERYEEAAIYRDEINRRKEK